MLLFKNYDGAAQSGWLQVTIAYMYISLLLPKTVDHYSIASWWEGMWSIQKAAD